MIIGNIIYGILLLIIIVNITYHVVSLNEENEE